MMWVMEQKKRFLVLFCLAGVLLAGCATREVTTGTGGTPGAVLIRKEWSLTGISHAGEFIALEPGHGTTASLFFRPDGKLEGTTGIGSFSGSWEIGGRTGKGAWKIRLNPGVGRREGKPNETALRFEQELLLALDAARALKTEKDSFLLLDSQGRTLLRYLYTGETIY